MTQQQIINVLTSVAPRIAETNDPEGVLLKAASDHNMYPAQLEKLGHAFNQMKTLVGLEKQANRGDSFRLLDVQGMVSKYASYDPERQLSKKDKKVHGQVNKLMKEAAATLDPWDEMLFTAKVSGMDKAASAGTQKSAALKKCERLDWMDRLREMGASVEDEDDSAYIIEKHASAPTREQLCKETVREVNALMESADNIIKEARYSLAGMVEKVASYVQDKGPQSWPEIVQDAVWQYGTKCARAVEACEKYMEQEHTPFNVLSKCASIRPAVVVDRHNMLDLLSDIDGHVMVIKEAAAAREQYAPALAEARAELAAIFEKAGAAAGPQGNSNPPPKNNPTNKKPKGKTQEPRKSESKKPDNVLPVKRMDILTPTMDTIRTVGDVAGIFLDDPNVEKKYIQDSKDRAAKEVTLHRLIMSDPVLSEVDPDLVRSHFNTIASISPTLAMDPNMTAAVLKESIQYGAIPLSMSKDLASFEDSVQKSRLDNNKNQADYGITGYSLNNEI